MVEVLKPSSPVFRQLIGVLMFCVVVLFLMWRVYKLQPAPDHLRGTLEVPHSFNHITVENLTYLEEPLGSTDIFNRTHMYRDLSANSTEDIEDEDIADDVSGDANLDEDFVNVSENYNSLSENVDVKS